MQGDLCSIYLSIFSGYSFAAALFVLAYFSITSGRSSIIFLQAKGSVRFAAPTCVAVAPASSILENNIYESVEIIGAGAFADCYRFERVIIPDSVVTIEKGAFMGCTALKSVTFSENSSLTTIDEGAFRDCPLLETIFIPKGVSVIGRYAFYCDNKLTTFDFAGSVEEWNAIEKGERWDVNTGNYIVNCNDGVLYKDE